MDNLSLRRQTGRSHGWYLGNVYEISREKHPIFLLFLDPGIEEAYKTYSRINGRRSDVMSLCFSTIVALLYTLKGKFVTYPAHVLRILIALGIGSNLTRLLTIKLAPLVANSMSKPLILFLRFYVHLVMTCLPPLAFAGLKMPSSKIGIYLTLFHNSRFLQSFFAMGLWSPGGFLSSLTLLTALMFSIMHWNQEECELLCSLQPGITAHYHDIYEVMPAFLRPGGNAVSTVAICVACRQILQVVFGCALPVILGVRREMASRAAFAKEVRLETRHLAVSDVLMQLAAVNAHFLGTLAVVALIFTWFPQLDHLPALLWGGWGHGWS
eukprot:jgi/Botrbrau1/20137/Bobra.0173s0039.1